MLSALFLCAPPEDRDNRSLSENSGQRTCQPKINLPEWKDISQKGDNTCGEIGQENSEHDAKRYSNAGLPWVTRQPARQRQGKNGEQHHQCKFCERCTELQGTPLSNRPITDSRCFSRKDKRQVRSGDPAPRHQGHRRDEPISVLRQLPANPAKEIGLPCHDSTGIPSRRPGQPHKNSGPRVTAGA